jgi:hypothetical protein
VAALVVPTAVALRGSVVDFFASEPAPKPVVLDFASLDAGAPVGMETRVIAEQTRAVLRKHLANGRVLTVWVAPTKKGGFCALYGHGGGCHPPYSIPVEHGISIQGAMANGVIRGGPVLISGSVQVPDAVAIELQYENGDSNREQLTWVSPPIGAAFFVLDVGREHWNKNRPRELALLDAGGAVLRREPVHFMTVMPPSIRQDGSPSDALLDEARKLISVDTHTGVEAALWIAPTADGRTCHWLRYGRGGFGGGCSVRESPQRFGLGRSQGENVVLLWGGPLRQDIREIEIRYEDGERVEVKAIEGMVLYDIPAAHFSRGHRPYLLVARDAEGRDVAQQTISTKDPGSYPCKTPCRSGQARRPVPS